MASKELQQDEMVGGYRVVRKVGEGGMGEVYEAWDANLNRRVAIKIMNDKATSDPELKDRFVGEGRTLARLRHPNVVALYSQGEHNGCPYMAMEFIEGKTLDEFLEYHPAGLATLVDFFRQMLSGLGAAHAAGIVHRDIKPQNILVGEDLQIKIIDFGVAKDHSDHLSHQTTANLVVGTAHYFAPEQVIGKMANPQTDLFSLGLVFMFMITGEKPFEGKSNLEILEKIRTTDVTLPGKISTLMPEKLRNVFSRLLKRNPALRYRNAKEALDELAEVNVSDLPKDLCVNPSPRITIANSAEVRRLCKDRQLTYLESRFVTNLAVDLQQSTGPGADATVALNTAPVAILDQKTVHEAIRRFQQARGLLVGSRTMSQAHYVEAVPRARSSLTVPVLFAVLVAGAFWFYNQNKPANASARPVPAAMTSTQKPNSPAAPPTPKPQEHAAPARSVAAETGGVPLQECKPGTILRFRTRLFKRDKLSEEKTRAWTFAGSKDGVQHWDADDGSVIKGLNDLFTPRTLISSNRTVKPLISGDPFTIYPLREGSRSEFTVSVTEPDEEGVERNLNYRERCEVQGKEKTISPAGEFQTFRIECKGDAAPFMREIIHYAPSLRMFVRREGWDQISIRKERHWIQELTGYELPH